jgi:hypothetical protein
VQAQLAAPHEQDVWVELANGTSIGNKWISLLPTNVSVVALRTVVTASAAPPKLRSLSAHLCSRAPPDTQCNIQADFAANGVGPMLLPGKTARQCCGACSAAPGCALFVYRPSGRASCTLYNASSVGGQRINGAISGSPPR